MQSLLSTQLSHSSLTTIAKVDLTDRFLKNSSSFIQPGPRLKPNHRMKPDDSEVIGEEIDSCRARDALSKKFSMCSQEIDSNESLGGVFFYHQTQYENQYFLNDTEMRKFPEKTVASCLHSKTELSGSVSTERAIVDPLLSAKSINSQITSDDSGHQICEHFMAINDPIVPSQVGAGSSPQVDSRSTSRQSEATLMSLAASWEETETSSKTLMANSGNEFSDSDYYLSDSGGDNP